MIKTKGIWNMHIYLFFNKILTFVRYLLLIIITGIFSKTQIFVLYSNIVLLLRVIVQFSAVLQHNYL